MVDVMLVTIRPYLLGCDSAFAYNDKVLWATWGCCLA